MTSDTLHTLHTFHIFGGMIDLAYCITSLIAYEIGLRRYAISEVFTVVKTESNWTLRILTSSMRMDHPCFHPFEEAKPELSSTCSAPYLGAGALIVFRSVYILYNVYFL